MLHVDINNSYVHMIIFVYRLHKWVSSMQITIFISNCVLINCILYILMNFDLNRVIKFQLIGENWEFIHRNFLCILNIYSRNGQAPGSWNILDFSLQYNYLQIIYFSSVVTEFSSTLNNRKTTLSKPYNSSHFHY